MVVYVACWRREAPSDACKPEKSCALIFWTKKKVLRRILTLKVKNVFIKCNTDASSVSSNDQSCVLYVHLIIIPIPLCLLTLQLHSISSIQPSKQLCNCELWSRTKCQHQLWHPSWKAVVIGALKSLSSETKAGWNWYEVQIQPPSPSIRATEETTDQSLTHSETNTGQKELRD